MSYSRSVREGLQDTQFDVAIIGGGINGVAIARECALAGRRVLLVEKADFAGGTTSRATRIIHGGLRYLEYGEIGLVRESLRERERLLKESPHLVRPLNFVLALPTHGVKRSALAVRAGLWVYGLLGRVTGSQSQGSRGDIAGLESALDRGLHLSFFSYEDAQCEYPERLVAEWLIDAAEAGAIVRNYTQALEIVVQDGRARGLRIRDAINGEETKISGDWIVNASGPWADEVLHHSQLDKQRLIGGVRGSHIVLPVFPGAPTQALYTEATDGRPIFLIPWAGQLLVGTTEEPHNDTPDSAEPAASEIEYLLASVRRLYPRVGITHSDIRYSYAGVRPLPYSPQNRLSAISRDYKLHDHLENGVAGLITVVGGKLTTAAALARRCARMMAIKVAEPSSAAVAVGIAGGIENTLMHWAQTAAKVAGIPASSALAIAELHGRRAMCIARTASSDPVLQRPLCSHSQHIVAEAVEAVQHEFAITLADILLRRVPVALGACWSDECSRAAASRVGAALAWTEREERAELENFIEERERFLHPSAGNPKTVRGESLLLERAH
jgi:glycerol-3-phosphate dehydrogenase